MPTLTIEPTLYQYVETAATENSLSIEQMLSEALRQYLWELDRRKISAESNAYRRRHVELKDRYLGQYIAMRGGEVVDNDADFQALRQRVRQRFGRKPVMITLVEDVIERGFVRHGFRMEAS
jgi:hypothetical protein